MLGAPLEGPRDHQNLDFHLDFLVFRPPWGSLSRSPGPSQGYIIRNRPHLHWEAPFFHLPPLPPHWRPKFRKDHPDDPLARAYHRAYHAHTRALSGATRPPRSGPNGSKSLNFLWMFCVGCFVRSFLSMFHYVCFFMVF